MEIEKQLLIRCGLNNTESLVLLDLVKNQITTASAIAKRLSLKRPTIYSAISNLEVSGLISTIRKAGVNKFAPLPNQDLIKSLRNLAKSKYEHVCEASQQLEPLLNNLKNINKNQFNSFEIISLESRRATENSLIEILAKGNYCAIFDPQTAITEKWQKFTDYILENTAKNKSPIKEIIVSGPKSNWYKKQISNPNHLIKEISLTENINADISLAQESVILNNYALGEEMSVQIKHKDYYKMMRAIFDSLWKSLK